MRAYHQSQPPGRFGSISRFKMRGGPVKSLGLAKSGGHHPITGHLGTSIIIQGVKRPDSQFDIHPPLAQGPPTKHENPPPPPFFKGGSQSPPLTKGDLGGFERGWNNHQTFYFLINLKRSGFTSGPRSPSGNNFFSFSAIPIPRYSSRIGSLFSGIEPFSIQPNQE